MALTTDQFANFAYSTLAGGGSGAGGSLTATDTTLTVKAGDGAKYSATTGGSFMVMLGSALGAHELVKVTARTSDTLTIARAQEGTTAQAWALGTFVQQVASAGNWSNLWNRVQGVVFNVMDYDAVGDGVTDDYTAIQAAITAAQTAGGGTLLFPDGRVFVTSTDPTVTGSNITILGTGGATLKAANTARPNCLTLNSASHIRVVGMTFDGNRANNSTAISYVTGACVRIYNCDDIEVSDCYVHDASAAGIYAEGSTHLRIHGNRVYNTFDGGIFLHPQTLGGCVDVTISGNEVSYAGYYGITAIRSDYVSIVGNTCSFNGQQDVTQGFGVDLEGARYSTIAGNVSHDNHGGIITRVTNEGGSAQNCAYVTITGNTCYNNFPTGTNGESSIAIENSDNTVIAGNTLASSVYGVSIGAGSTQTLVSGNRISAHKDNGINCTDTTCSDIILSGNDIAANTNNGIGIAVAYSVIKGNAIHGNTNEGINVLVGATGLVVSGNDIYDNHDNGILLAGDASVNGTMVRDNHFYVVSATQQRALYEVSGCGATVMANNRITGQTTSPYHFSNVASRYADEHTLASVTITSAYTALVDDNIILCNAAAALTVTLPSASTVGAGHVYTIKDHNGTSATNVITLATTSAQTIDGAASKTITTAYGALRVISDGSNWSVI